MWKIFTAITLGIFGSSPAWADTLCGPQVITRVLTYSDGRVMIFAPWRNDFTDICNLQTTRNGVTPNTCFGWFSKISTAVAQQKKISIYYLTASGVTTCATIPTYASSPAPGYIELAF